MIPSMRWNLHSFLTHFSRLESIRFLHLVLTHMDRDRRSGDLGRHSGDPGHHSGVDLFGRDFTVLGRARHLHGGSIPKNPDSH